MPEVLKPITQFTSPRDVGDVAVQILGMINDPAIRKLLQKRHLTGVLERFPRVANPKAADITAAARRIQRARERHQQGAVGTFAVLNSSEDVIGLATVIPGLRLKRHRTLVPKLFSTGFLQEKIAIAGPEVTAWTSEHNAELVDNVLGSRLGEAYAALLKPSGPVEQFAGEGNNRSNPWTIEPQAVPSWIHGAIASSGLQRRGLEARFDDGEPEKLWYPYSVLYSSRPILQFSTREA